MKYHNLYSTSIVNRRIYRILFIVVILVSSSCEAFVDIEPPKNELVAESVFESNNTANAAMVNAYSSIVDGSSFMTYYLPLMTGLYCDELQDNVNAENDAYYKNYLDELSFTPTRFWNASFNYIYKVNSIIEGTRASKGISNELKAILTGESLFLRAWWNFHLVNLYGEIPLVLTTDYVKNSKLPRQSTDEVYKQIMSDLIEALKLLPEHYVDGLGRPESQERVRANKNVVRAFLARAALYMRDYSTAEKYSTELIAQISVYDIIPVSQVFLKNSKETIWAIPPSAAGSIVNTYEGNRFIVRANRAASVISNQLLSSFAASDLRYQNWIGTFNSTNPVLKIYFPYKYKKFDASSITEYSIALRLSEQYLIRAEARAQQNNLPAAREDLNIIRRRAGVTETITTNKDHLLTEIFEERRKELFSEWCHRWFDLKRTGRADEVMKNVALQKGGVWDPNKKLWPIAINEIQLNSNLTQNPGYFH